MSANLLQTRDGRVQRITLARTEKRNALSGEFCRELVAALSAAADAPDVGAILLTAEGKAFCAGMDLDESSRPDAADVTAIHDELFTIGTRLRKPLIAAVHHAAYGGGVGLVANAHIVLASEDAAFGLTEIRLAMWPYVIYRALVRAMGPRRTLELSLTGRLFPASEARTYGLVHEVTPAADLLPRAEDLARQLSNFSADALRRGLEFTFVSEGLPADAAGALALQHRASAFGSPDYQEGVHAFREKRPPSWPSNR